MTDLREDGYPLYAPDVRWDGIEPQLASRVADRFSERVLDKTSLPVVRRADLRESCELHLSEDQGRLHLTCTITGSTYVRTWDGEDATVLALADEAADDTAFLVAETGHYSWLWSRR